jgi:hypothetical protein
VDESQLIDLSNEENRMPYVKGFLQIVPGQPPEVWPGPGTPEHPIAGPPPEVWPGPGYPDQGLPQPPPGIWPPLTPSHPIAPVPPTVNPPPPAGEIWPPIEGAPPGKFVVLVYIPGVGYKYVVVDPSLKPTPSK